MKKSILSRLDLEKLANVILPTMIDKAKNDTLTFDFESLGNNYLVHYKKNLQDHWVLFDYSTTKVM